MGVRYRKSINLGPLRINLSKSGIGYSYGVKGLRYTKTAKGNDRVTMSIPGTGISHVTESKSRKKSPPSRSARDLRQRQEIMEKYNLTEKKMQEFERDVMRNPAKFRRLVKNEEKMDRYMRKHYSKKKRSIPDWVWVILLILCFILILLSK